MLEPRAALSISRKIGAPADELFAHLARPADHRAIDGSGMVRSADDQQVLSGVGDVFEMRMHNDFLGDYVTENHVVEFERGRRIAWEPVLKETDHPEGGRTSVWSRTSAGDGSWLRSPTEGRLVTETYDLSRCPEWLREAVCSPGSR